MYVISFSALDRVSENCLTSPLDRFVPSDKKRYKTATLFVADALREGIMSGTVAEGTPLRQDELAEKFGLSRMPIRDAIRQLESEGLVVQEPHKGATVATMTVDDIVEIFDMRAMAECSALSIAFDALEQQTIDELEAVLDRMDQSRSPDRLSELNREFHDLLYRRAKRPRLQTLIKSLHDSVDRYLRVLLVNLDYHTRSQEDHRRIVKACASGDREAAVAALENHLMGGKNEVVTFLNHRHALRKRDEP